MSDDFLLLVSYAVLACGFLILFTKEKLLGLFLIAVSLGLITLYRRSPQAKRMRMKAEADERAKIENERTIVKMVESLKDGFNKLSNNPSDTNSLAHVLNILNSLDKNSLKTLMQDFIIPLLRLKPLDESVRNTIFSSAQKANLPNIDLQELYEISLEILAKHPDQMSLKSYVLKVGRLYYGKARPGGRVTIYDEQAIQNDITVRSK